MKKKVFLHIGLAMFMLGLFSCEEWMTTPADQDKYFGLKSYEIEETEPLPAPEILYDFCGDIQLFELWYKYKVDDQVNLDVFGTVAVYNDATTLYIQFDLLEDIANAGWYINQTYLYIGSSIDWEDDGYDDDDGNDIDWTTTDIVTHDGQPTTVVRTVPIEEWMIKNCFYLAVKTKLFNVDRDTYPHSRLPRAFLNLSDRLDDIWLEKLCLDECDYPGTGTPGYWKNHPDAWPVDEIDIGGVTYSKEEAIAIMNTAGKGDKTWNLFSHLVAAKLNVEMGNPDGCIADGIMAADDWMAMYGPVWSGVKASSEEWKSIESTFHMLDEYNNGLMCAPKRD
jgi:hypothetical protein